MPTHVWNDPQYRRYFRGVRDILLDLRKRRCFHYDMGEDIVFARLVDKAVASTSSDSAEYPVSDDMPDLK